MQLFIVDAFTNKLFGGNQAGVVLLPRDRKFPDDAVMRNIAAELRHSETAFVQAMEDGVFKLRYFTPEGEVPLCGHATISAFTVLRDEKQIKCGAYRAATSAGELHVTVDKDRIWLEMPPGEMVKQLTDEDSARVYDAYGLTQADRPEGMQPSIVKVGLADILLPVGSRERLDSAVQNREAVIALSREFNVVGAHLFCCPPDGPTAAFCRNFAPLYGIDEESATGTSNASLTYFLFRQGRIASGAVNTFVQGEAMGRPSAILSRIGDGGTIEIGGNAVISVKGNLNIEIR